MRHQFLTVMALAGLLSGCSPGDAANDSEPDNSAIENIAIAADWPSSLRVVGDGYPASGDPCRRIGETEATANWLDDSADLVGCQSADDASRLGGSVVGTVDGVTIVSVPRGDANAGLDGDAKVPGTDYNATTTIPCGAAGKLDSDCKAGVKRKWGDDGSTLVEVTRADGRKRGLFFDAQGKAIGADGAQSDGSAGWSFKTSRDDDWTVIEFGPERYRVPDALVLGG